MAETPLRVSSWASSPRLRFVLSRGCDLWRGCLTWRWVGQVIAPLLIVQRVANKSALTSNTVVSGRLSFRARGGEESTSGGGVLSDGYPVGSAGRHEYRNNFGEVEVEAEIAVDFLQNKA